MTPVLLAWAVKVEWLNISHLEKVRCHTIFLSNGPRGHRHCSRSGKRDAVRRFRLSKSWAHLSKMSSSSEAENRSAAEDELSFWDGMPQSPCAELRLAPPSPDYPLAGHAHTPVTLHAICNGHNPSARARVWRPSNNSILVYVMRLHDPRGCPREGTTYPYPRGVRGEQLS